MDIDTQLVVISNPDLGAELDQFEERNGTDPLKALKRRLDKHEFRYLTNLSLEAELIRRELTNETAVWSADDYADLDERIRESLVIDVSDGARIRGRELAPHAVEAAALYSVVSRLDAENLPGDVSLVDKALLYDRGWIQRGDSRHHAEEFAFSGGDGTHGIPVTYTRDVIANLLHHDTDRQHPALDVASVVMPTDVLNRMAEGLGDAPVFSRAESTEFEGRLAVVKDYVAERQETDVLNAILAEKGVEEATVAEYVEHVYAWDGDGTVETDRGPVDPDPLLMKVFETEHLGRFDDDDYAGDAPDEDVESFRREKVITALNRYAWENRDEAFSVSNVDLTEIPVVRSVLEAHDWTDVRRLFPDFDPDQWDDPPANTETERVKSRTVEELQSMGYTAASAELTSRAVLREVSYAWD
jgi:non-specific serine/threonine protein kinase